MCVCVSSERATRSPDESGCTYFSYNPFPLCCAFAFSVSRLLLLIPTCCSCFPESRACVLIVYCLRHDRNITHSHSLAFVVRHPGTIRIGYVAGNQSIEDLLMSILLRPAPWFVTLVVLPRFDAHTRISAITW